MLCCICLTKKTNCTLKPCNHSSFCDGCIFNMMTLNRQATCPLCRKFFFYIRSNASTIDSDDEATDYWKEMADNEEWRLSVGTDFGMEPDAFATFVQCQIAALEK